MSRQRPGGRGQAGVDADDAGGDCTTTEHLLAAGRRRVATVAGPRDPIAGIDRHAGDRRPPGAR
ncbi:hypothetical protein ACI8AA_02420 [Geodermatophilus sp. SYSU D01180]